ncbi:hypothetical protein Y032_0017g3267 [Ancylostoma ceylanicum]|uniref:Uncharacterized protein n=1 Tax=Ancylostoma ceylanicum TaxID=53326 RepID=A0A016V4V8_9BILA|nr:hypothetical protein Y032_0017g3267 [Ancylostoma ceylanicum]
MEFRELRNFSSVKDLGIFIDLLLKAALTKIVVYVRVKPRNPVDGAYSIHYIAYTVLGHVPHARPTSLRDATDTKTFAVPSAFTSISPQVDPYSLCSTYRCKCLANGYTVNDSPWK